MQPVAYRRYLLAILTLTALFNYVDRIALGIVLEDIKADLALSDTQLGVLTGIAFALFYSAMGVPIARWADRGNRVTIIAATTLLWSLAVGLCSAAQTFIQLVFVRVFVAVGEAGCLPPALSLLSDHFARAERARALSIFMASGSVSAFVGYFFVGWLNELYGWRTTFLLMALPGLVLGTLVWMTLSDPRRSRSPVQAVERTDTAATAPKLKEVCITLWSIATLRHLLWTIALLFFFSFGIGQWLPTYLIRSFGLTTGELGTLLAIVYSVSGIAGAYLGGEWASRRAANNERLQLIGGSIALVVCGVCMVFVFVSANVAWALVMLGIAAGTSAAVYGPVFAIIQALVPDSMRAVAIALVYLFANLIGMGVGPLVTGILSDSLRAMFGEESLRYALLSLTPGHLLIAWYLYRASKVVTADLRHVERHYNDSRRQGEPVPSAVRS